MGQLNISRIQSTQSVIIPPTNVEGIYNYSGTFYQINNSGESQPLNALKQIAITLSNTEILDLYTTPKVIVPAAGNDVVNQVISGYINIDIVTTFNPSGSSVVLEIYEGGTEETFFNNCLQATQSGRFRFMEKHDPLVQNVKTYTTNNAITLTTGSTFSQGTASATVYLTYTQFNESLL